MVNKMQEKYKQNTCSTTVTARQAKYNVKKGKPRGRTG